MTTGGEGATRLVIEGPGAGVEVTASSVAGRPGRSGRSPAVANATKTKPDQMTGTVCDPEQLPDSMCDLLAQGHCME